MQGFVLIDKPQGFTSFDAVAVMRGVAGTKKVGHTGTLDPMATGVLPILIGRATKLLDLLPEQNKRYTATIRLGEETDTLDITGRVVRTTGLFAPHQEVAAVLNTFQGSQMQVPPMYSAVQKNGQRLYDLARKGLEVEREARPVTIHSIAMTACRPDKREYDLDVLCSKGTYIRSLCHDLGRALGCGAVLAALRRTEACGFNLTQCTPLQKARQMPIGQLLQPVSLLLEAYPALRMSAAQAVRFQNGGALDFARLRLPPGCSGLYRMLDDNGRLVGLGEAMPERGQVKMRCLLEAEPHDEVK